MNSKKKLIEYFKIYFLNIEDNKLVDKMFDKMYK